MNTPELSIIILNYKSEAFCHKCLESIAKNTPSAEYEIILVDNASRDGSLMNLRNKWKEKLPLRFVELVKNLGYGQGNEAGITLAKGRYIAVMNPDIEVHAGTFDGLLRYLKENEKVGLVAPKLILPNKKMQDSFRRFPSLPDMVIKRIGFLRKVFPKRIARFLMWNINLTVPTAVDWVVGAFFIARKDAWKKVGGFDPRYFLFLEDTDICRSLWSHGWQVVFHPQYSALHNHERLSETKGIFDFFRKKTVQIHAMSAFKYFWKWKGKPNPRNTK